MACQNLTPIPSTPKYAPLIPSPTSVFSPYLLCQCQPGHSLQTGAAIDQLKDWMVSVMPEGPTLYNKDYIAQAPERFFGELSCAAILRHWRRLTSAQRFPLWTVPSHGLDGQVPLMDSSLLLAIWTESSAWQRVWLQGYDLQQTARTRVRVHMVLCACHQRCHKPFRSVRDHSREDI